MAPADDAAQFEALLRVARITGTDASLIVEWVERRLVAIPQGGWDEAAVEEVRRVRRLSALGINAAGLEVVLHMRTELMRLQSELAEMRRQMAIARRQHDEAMARLLSGRRSGPGADVG